MQQLQRRSPGVVGYDLLQRRRAILRNFPLIGHFRYVLEAFGPELRQYIVTSNNEERPFSRDQRRWIEASSEGRPNVFGFGTDDEMEAVESLLIIKHSPFPAPAPRRGRARAARRTTRSPPPRCSARFHRRRHAFRPRSVVNLSGMSYGALSPAGRGGPQSRRALAGCLQNTGEGGLAPAHRNGGELIFQIGTGYFGCRDEQGRFSLERLRERVPRRRCARSRSSSHRAPSRGSADCCPASRSPPRSPPSAACPPARTASARPRTPPSPTSTS